MSSQPFQHTEYPVGTLLGRTIIGPCGFGVEVVEDSDGKRIIFEEYTGDRKPLRRDLIKGIVQE